MWVSHTFVSLFLSFINIIFISGHTHDAAQKEPHESLALTSTLPNETPVTNSQAQPSSLPKLSPSPAELSNETLAALHYERVSRTTPAGNDNPFYILPPLSSPLPPPGTVLRVESVTNTSDYTIPPNTALSRFIYVSETLNGTLVPVSAYILWPFIGRKNSRSLESSDVVRGGGDGNNKYGKIGSRGMDGVSGEEKLNEDNNHEAKKTRNFSSNKTQENGDYQIVAWAHGTSGISSTCAPSHYRNLWQHFLAPYQLVLNGYIVIATDYAGLGVSSFSYNTTKRNSSQPIPIIHEYISNPSAANDVIHSVTAARTAFPILGEKFVVAGHSQGGGAAWAVAQREVEFPTPGYLGAVAISPVTSFLDMDDLEAISFGIPVGPGIASIFGSISEVNMPSHTTSFYSHLNLTPKYGNFELKSVFEVPALQALRTLEEIQGCNAVTDYLFIESILNGTALTQNWQDNSYYQLFSNLTVNGGKPISGPLLIIHGESDTTINISMTENAIQKTLLFLTGSNRTGTRTSSIEFLRMPDSDHTSALTGSQALWMRWIAERFEGVDVNLGSGSEGEDEFGGKGNGWGKRQAVVGYKEERVQRIRLGEGVYQGDLNWFVGLATEPYETT